MDPRVWEQELEQCAIPESEKEYILTGLRGGFRLFDCDEDVIPAYDCANYDSAENVNAKPKLDRLFQSEVLDGKLSKVDTKPKCIHAIGAVPKKDSEELRPITDCKRPLNVSLNNHMDYPSQKYQTIDDATKLMSLGCYFSVVDIKKAYRTVPVFPAHRQYQGLRWMFGELDKSQYDYYVDNFLCFGLSCAPGIFCRISNCVSAMLKARGVKANVHYIDDFLVTGETYDECLHGQTELLHLLRRLGFAISWAKVIGPTQRVCFLGIMLDSIAMKASLPEDKLCRLISTVHSFNGRKKAKQKELQRLAGVLNHASSVVKGGRTFLRRVLDTMNTARQPHHYVRLTLEFRKDIAWWISFVQLFNGKAKIIEAKPVGLASFQTDASFSGFGAYYMGDYLLGSWHPETVLHAPDHVLLHHRVTHACPESFLGNINYLELLPVVYAARRWAESLSRKHIVVYTDNSSVVSFINKGTCRNSCAMEYLRELFWLSSTHNFHITARHLCGRDNVIADGLSRLAEEDKWDNLCGYVHSHRVLFSSRSAGRADC